MYCTVNDLLGSIREETIIELSDDSDTPTSINVDIVNQMIVQADNEIDGYIRGRYILPLDPVPGVIKDISVDMSIYNLWTRRPERAAPDAIIKKYNDRIKRLQDIAEGVFLVNAPQLGASDSTGKDNYCKTNKTARDRKFTKEKLKMFEGWQESYLHTGNFGGFFR
jgi:phage gp36-like protein